MNDLIALLATLLSFIPGMHPNNYCTMFSNSEYIGYIIGISMVLSLLSIILFYSSSDSTIGPVLGRIFSYKKEYIIFYTVLFLIGGMFGIALGQLYEVMVHLKDFRYFIYVITIFLIIYLFIQKDFRFILGVLLSGAWGILVLDERYMFHIFAGMFGLAFIFLRNHKLNETVKTTDDKKDLVLYVILGIVFGYLSLMFPGISSPSIFGSLFIWLSGPMQYIHYYATYIGFQSTASVYYYFYTNNVRNGYVVCVASETKLFEMIIGMILGILLLILIRDKLTKLNNPIIYWVVALTILIMAYQLEGVYGIFVLLGSTLISYINLNILKAGADSNMGVVIVPTLLLITSFFLNY